jgi:hypothetical protein
MSNAELLALSRRLRGKSALLLDADWSFAEDLIMASFALETLLEAREAVDAILIEVMPCIPPSCS